VSSQNGFPRLFEKNNHTLNTVSKFQAYFCVLFVTVKYVATIYIWRTVLLSRRLSKQRTAWSYRTSYLRPLLLCRTIKVEEIHLLRSINYSPAQTTALNQLIKRIPWNAGSRASSPCSFAHNDTFSSLFAVLELGGRF